VIGEIAPDVQLRGVAWVQNCARGEMLIKKRFSTEQEFAIAITIAFEKLIRINQTLMYNF
jgi:hypothetical protein